MGSISDFLTHMDWESLLSTLFYALAALICLTVHELCHGLTALSLGDPTAKNAGRLTLNPIRHIDPLGLILMITVHVGWAKPVPVDTGRFKRPKRDMALTALAGPVSNFILAWLFLLLAGGVERLRWGPLIDAPAWAFHSLYYLARFLVSGGVLSAGLGVFNLFPVPPLDGSRILFAFFPDRVYYTVLRYERYVMLVMLIAVWAGVFSAPLSFLITHVCEFLRRAAFFPYPLF